MIDDKWATYNLHFANYLNKDLPTMNPSHQHVEDYCSKLMKMWNNVYNKLHDNLLVQLQGLSRYHFSCLIESQQPAKKIQAIHNQVLRSSTKCDKEYLKRVLEFFKGPQKFHREWIHLTIQSVEKQYQIKLPVSSKKNFIKSIADNMFNDTFNQRFRRGMKQAVGAVWYDRLLPPNNILFKEFDTKTEMKEVVVGNQMCKGHLVRKVGAKSREESEELGCFQSKDCEHIYNNIDSGEDFIVGMRKIWRQKGASSTFPQKSLMQKSGNGSENDDDRGD